MIYSKIFCSFAILGILFFSCKDDDNTTDPDAEEISYDVDGFTYGSINTSFQTVDTNLINILDQVAPISVVANVSHHDNASSVNLNLDSTKVVIFGNPMLGTPLMQQNQLTGLDLPQKLLLFKDASDIVRIAYNNVSYLEARHGLQGLDQLATIENALQNFVNSSGAEQIVSNAADETENAEGIITKTSTQSFEDSYASLINAINGNANLRLVAELDHQANAASVNQELRPTRIVIFGNPNLGTPLMQSSQTIGIDLPQKILIWQDADDTVYISYNDPSYLVSRHQISNQEEVVNTISGALDNLSNAAAGL